MKAVAFEAPKASGKEVAVNETIVKGTPINEAFADDSSSPLSSLHSSRVSTPTPRRPTVEPFTPEQQLFHPESPNNTSETHYLSKLRSSTLEKAFEMVDKRALSTPSLHERSSSTVSDMYDDDDYEPGVETEDHDEYAEITEPAPEQTSKLSKGTKRQRTSNVKPDGERRRKAPAKPWAAKSPISRSIDQLTEPDKLLWTMRKAGHTFIQIQPHYEALTNTKVASSTLPNRYGRLLENVVVFAEEDDELLRDAIILLRKVFESEIWEMAREIIVKKGGGKFPAKALSQRYDDLMKIDAEAAEATGPTNADDESPGDESAEDESVDDEDADEEMD